MGTIGTRLVERLKETALRMGTEGVRLVVEGTVTAVRTMDRLQELLPKEQQVVRVKREPATGMEHQREEPALYRPIPARPVVSRPTKEVREKARATAQLVLEEARAVEERLKKAQPAPQPLQVSAELEEETLATPKRRTARKTPRTQGRKTTATATAPKRATAQTGGFKAKRGQKHGH
ncbi:hypothetical protein [Archangium sp.]|uniref:hypothetical protein n=1 Tax=Archangium sp. TaxID=1872627 RepID=UPI002D4A6D48|nr:hypothetical protein [Archangium sp.]HYO53657.1 hypothetical protein [Archangium sp.]